jgi:hypothetical protein
MMSCERAACSNPPLEGALHKNRLLHKNALTCTKRSSLDPQCGPEFAHAHHDFRGVRRYGPGLLFGKRIEGERDQLQRGRETLRLGDQANDALVGFGQHGVLPAHRIEYPVFEHMIDTKSTGLYKP